MWRVFRQVSRNAHATLTKSVEVFAHTNASASTIYDPHSTLNTVHRALKALHAKGSQASFQSLHVARHHVRSVKNTASSGGVGPYSGLSALIKQQRFTHGYSTLQLQQARSYYRDARGYTHFKRSNIAVWRSPQGQERAGKLGLALAGIVVYVYFTNQQEIPYVHRRHLILCSIGVEKAMGEAAFAQVKAEAAARGHLLPSNHKAVQAVKTVGSRLAQIAGNGVGGGFQAQLKNMKWEFIVVDSNEPNAFVLPGGKVCVYTGLMRLLKTEDELAAVLAHELAHVVARHPAERLTQQSVFQILQMVVYFAVGFTVPVGVAQLAFFLPYSRSNETEADLIGMHIAAQACFNPGAGATVFATLEQFEKAAGMGTVPGFLRTHPVNEKRIARINQEIPKAMQTYNAARAEALDGAIEWSGSPGV